MRVPAAAIILALISCPVPAQQHRIYTFAGTGYFDVAGAGDVNRDGVPDVVIALSGNATVVSGRDGGVLHAFSVPSGLGMKVGGAGDVDRDGHADVVVGMQFAGVNGAYSGSAHVYSGKDGKKLYSFHGDATSDHFGSSVSGAGDVDNDGHADVVIGAPKVWPVHIGYARVISGKSGKVLYTFKDNVSLSKFGTAVSGAGDMNRDGHADILVGAWGTNSFNGRVFVYSGKDGSVLRKFDGPTKTTYLGFAVKNASDVNRDGYDDVIASGLGGVVFVYSGKDGRQLHAFSGSSSDQFGYAVSGAGDVDGDGHADLVVTAPYEPFKPSLVWHIPGIPGPGRVRVYSGRTGAVLSVLSGTTNHEGFGRSVGGAGDVNEDGFSDLVVGALQVGTAKGYATVLSAVPLPLVSGTHSISITGGGKQVFSLDASATHAGRYYLLLGSLSGRRPGIPVGPGITLPLNYDPYLQFSINSPNVLITNSLGRLDGKGQAGAQLVLPPQLSPSLVGLRLDHAFVVATPRPLVFHFASNAVPLRLVK